MRTLAAAAGPWRFAPPTGQGRVHGGTVGCAAASSLAVVGDVLVVDELAVLRALGQGTDHRDAESILRDGGWTSCGAGDWAIALRSPSGVHAARISPFDPAAPYNAELYRRAVHTGQVPRLEAEVELDGGASLLVLEFLHPVELDRAAAFHQAIAVGAPEVAELSELVAAVHLEARRELPWCGPVDINPTNVMQAQGGRLVLIDPFYADGPNLYGTILTDPARVAATIPENRRRHMFDLPLRSSGAPTPGVLAQMRDAITAADAHQHSPQD